jgi:hypothetical protein
MERLLTTLVRVKTHPRPLIEDLRLIISDLTACHPVQHSFWPRHARRLAAATEVAAILARRHGKPLLFHAALAAPNAVFDQDRSHLAPVGADVADVPADRAAAGAAWPAADVAAPAILEDVGATRAGSRSRSRSGGNGEAIPHGVHWW